MLDLFTIFTKGGIVLWYFQGTALSLTPAVNALIKSVILQERGGANAFNYEKLTLKFKMDNELELIFVVVYQNILKLSYVDKLLDQVHLAFRDKYKNEIATGAYRPMNFSGEFDIILRRLEEQAQIQTLQPRPMKSFEESRKADKSLVGSKPRPEAKPSAGIEVVVNGEGGSGEDSSPQASLSDDSLRSKGKRLVSRDERRKPSRRSSGKKPPAPKQPVKRVKEQRKWEGVVSREEAATLDFSDLPSGNGNAQCNGEFQPDYSMVGKMKGELQSLEADSPPENTASKSTSTANGGGVFKFFKNLTGGKTITREGMQSVLEQMKEHLIAKNVAAEISEKLCESVAAKLEGKVIGTFRGIQSTVQASMEESLVQILSPKRRVDILRDVMESRDAGKPFAITFCGVNGVGKSTNLAKVAFWLLENGLRVIIAGCDTFRSGAVEQLRTHTRHLAALHPPQREGGPAMVTLYERGYGKDAAGIAMEAIHYARQQHYDVVLVDTAGRMQDNEPLMRALSKLIRVNSPDLVLFVGEALVGNEAVDQLDKFNRALIDHSDDQNPRVIDGILLTKFDTIDDKVGAAISMTYTTGQPIVFVGTGQTYTDLKSLNVQAVVSALLK